MWTKLDIAAIDVNIPFLTVYFINTLLLYVLFVYSFVYMCEVIFGLKHELLS